MLTLQGQVSQFGAEAGMLKVMPDSDDPARLDLASQAIDYALGKGRNPFADIDRLTLSRIGLDESGAFTPAERSAAILEMASRDNDYAKKVYAAQQSSELGGRESGSRLIQVSALLEKAKGMTEEEQMMMGVSVGALKAEQGALSEKNNRKDIKIDYENLKAETDSVLSAISIGGGSKWINVSISNLASEKLLSASSLSFSSTDFNTRENGWIQIYTKISDLS